MQIRMEKLNEIALKAEAKKQSKLKMKYVSANNLVNRIVEDYFSKKKPC